MLIKMEVCEMDRRTFLKTLGAGLVAGCSDERDLDSLILEGPERPDTNRIIDPTTGLPVTQDTGSSDGEPVSTPKSGNAGVVG
jgi:hypothetical protein